MNFYALIDCICGTPNIFEERNESLSGKHGDVLFVNVVFILESFLYITLLPGELMA